MSCDEFIIFKQETMHLILIHIHMYYILHFTIYKIFNCSSDGKKYFLERINRTFFKFESVTNKIILQYCTGSQSIFRSLILVMHFSLPVITKQY